MPGKIPFGSRLGGFLAGPEIPYAGAHVSVCLPKGTINEFSPFSFGSSFFSFEEG
jgi:hypothetical protein